MCGLVGFLRRASSDDLEAHVLRMADRLYHRGPNDRGAWADSSVGVAFGFRRLSIVDLSPAGHQPMSSACGRYVLVFNGEIYNHTALRTELAAAGLVRPWRGHSDTETLLEAFTKWGIRASLVRAVGMFALAVWDKVERCLTLARDRFGEKPLYYGWVGIGAERALVFGSELKALRTYPGFSNPISRDALALYMQRCYVPAPYSIYERVFKLSPGCLLTFHPVDLQTETVSIETYWSLAEVAHRGLADPIRDVHEALSALESTVHDAVALQRVADVPLGAFLSGGVDSSLVVALMQAQSTRPVQTFTVGFEEAGFDESTYASAVAKHLGTEHHLVWTTSAEARAVIPCLPDLYDEPFADSSQIPTYLVCKAAREHVTVALTGDAGDEMFGGYNRYIWGSRISRWFNRFPPAGARFAAELIHLLSIQSWNSLGEVCASNNGVARLGEKAYKLAERLQHVGEPSAFYRSLVTEWSDWRNLVIGAGWVPTVLEDSNLVRGIHAIEHRMMIWDALTYLPDDILAKVDRAAMGVSLETRVPLLDHRIAELAWRLPLSAKIRNGQSKWALRQILGRYVPSELIERPKSGFSIPLGDWLRGPLRDWATSLLEDSRIEKHGYLNAKLVQETWKQHLSFNRDWTSRIWTVLMFEAWLEANS